MARVLALIPDLLFGSRVQGALTAAGHDVLLLTDESKLAGLLENPHEPSVDVLVLDLTGPELDPVGMVDSLSHLPPGRVPRTLAFYSHVDTAVRERAEQAGIDLVVPRSRMAREGSELVRRVAGS